MFKRNFFLSMLSGEDGISSKRSVMIFFVLLFSFNVLWNLFTGKAPAPIYQEQVFELVVICLGVVFGEGILKMITDLRNTKKTTNTTIVSPPDSTVTTITDTKEPEKKV
jgi:hypothetical protein